MRRRSVQNIGPVDYLFVVVVTEYRMHVLNNTFLLGNIEVCPFAGYALLKQSSYGGSRCASSRLETENMRRSFNRLPADIDFADGIITDTAHVRVN